MIFEETNDNKKIKKSEIIIKKINSILEKEIHNIKNENIKSCNEKNINFIKRCIKNPKYQEIIIKHILDLENREDIINLFNETKLLDEIIKDDKRNEFKKAYYIYIIGEFKIENKYDFLMESCESKSIYVQVNTIRTLAKLGNYEYYIKGLKNILSSNTLIHKKVIIESLFLFNKINPILHNNLVKELDTNNNQLKVVIINYFTSIKYYEIGNKIYELLSNPESDKEVIIACIKYFFDDNSIDIKDRLIDLLKNNHWEIRAISSTALRKYNSDDVLNALKQSITDEVWYVRQNSARSLVYMIKDESNLLKFINNDDKYAYDAVLSVLSENNSIDEYDKLK